MIHVATLLAYLRDRGRKPIALGMGEDRASCYDHKQRMTTVEGWDPRRKVGPNVAAEESRNVDQAVAAEIEKDERG